VAGLKQYYKPPAAQQALLSISLVQIASGQLRVSLEQQQQLVCARRMLLYACITPWFG
jgi:hypothetical protein